VLLVSSLVTVVAEKSRIGAPKSIVPAANASFY